MDRKQIIFDLIDDEIDHLELGENERALRNAARRHIIGAGVDRDEVRETVRRMAHVWMDDTQSERPPSTTDLICEALAGLDETGKELVLDAVRSMKTPRGGSLRTIREEFLERVRRDAAREINTARLDGDWRRVEFLSWTIIAASAELAEFRK